MGNRTSASNAEGEIVHNANNELERYGEREFKYDDNGNLIDVWQHGGVARRDSDNADNRLITDTAAAGGIQASYYYDPFGRRLWKEMSGIRTYFFYSDEGFVAEYDATGTELKSYGYKPDSTWTTDPLWLKQGNEYYFYQNDHLGTPQKLVAQNDAVVWSAQYSAFGKASLELETVTNNLRFPGQYYDEETGFHYNWHRYYEPKFGRYLRTDPLGLKEGINLYVYVMNNPINIRDQEGRASDVCAIKWALSASQRSGIPVLSELDAYLSGRLGCTMSAIKVAHQTFMNLFPGNPVQNGFNVLHCYSNCLLANTCPTGGFSQSDFGQLMYANKVYEECSKEDEMCEEWCKGLNTDDFGDYRDDVESDFEADILGLCKGIELRHNFVKGQDCVAACMSQTDEDTGPVQDHQCDSTNKEKRLCCESSFQRNPRFYPDIVDDIYSGLGDMSYDTQCPRIYPQFGVQ